MSTTDPTASVTADAEERRPVAGTVPHLAVLGAVRSRLSPHLPRGPYWRLAKWYAERHAVVVGGFETPVRPYAIRWVDPADVVRPTGRPYPPWEDRFDQCGTVVTDDWDRQPAAVDTEEYPSACIYHADRLDETVLFRSLDAHFTEGVPWVETDLVAVASDIVEDGTAVWHDCTSREDVLARCERMDALWSRLSTESFRSQLDLAAAGETDHRVFDDAIRNEIAVDVGRDGEFFLVDGRHRHAMATLLGVEAIPVVVYARHPEWMTHRDAAAAGGTGTDSSVGDDHPDLRGLRNLSSTR
ncbi:hypothetical protein ACFO0N_13305 [Halobium salinum]|uniref:ParB-like nuclease domain-containing protein n=1 Tax=Halobium salinum TaxID=1364940 RepID=A0ABD5PDT9_9EURY|nr:hypothetical protein [Halobium salinum]